MGEGQDVWIKAQFPEGFKGRAVDVGANNGEYLSNTLLLEDAGWDVLCIEADHRYALPLTLSRKRVMFCAINGTGGDWATLYAAEQPTASEQMLAPRRGSTSCPHGKHLRVPLLTLDMVLHMTGWEGIDLLSIDIEGGELDALKGFDFDRWDPKVIVCEDLENEHLLAEVLNPHGYKYVTSFTFDRCFVRDDA